MEYSIKFDIKAAEYFAGLGRKIQRQIGRKIDNLKADPHPPTSKKLKDNLYRIRSGDYRIIYSVGEKEIVVYILRIGDRKDVYRHLGKM